MKETFKDLIMRKAKNPDIYREYTKDRRAVMGDAKLKGDAHQKKLADQNELTILKAIYFVEGDINLDKNQLRKLREAGIIKKKRNYEDYNYNDSSEEALDDFKEF